jgi:hypothetical protein
MTPAQRDLFLAAAKERRSGWGFNNMPLPDLSRWADGRLSLTARPMTRIRERHGTNNRYRDEAAAPADNPPRLPVRPNSPPATPAAGRGTTTRFPVTQVEFLLDCGAERPLRSFLIVAAPHSTDAHSGPPDVR